MNGFYSYIDEWQMDRHIFTGNYFGAGRKAKKIDNSYLLRGK